MAQNVIWVPQGCPTVEKAMALAVVFSGRKEYTETEPLKIRLEEGVHEIVGNPGKNQQGYYTYGNRKTALGFYYDARRKKMARTYPGLTISDQNDILRRKYMQMPENRKQKYQDLERDQVVDGDSVHQGSKSSSSSSSRYIHVTCNHITFVGKGKAQTTILGGFNVNNQQHVKFEELTITNPHRYGRGLRLEGSETNVDLLKCAVKECRGTGMNVHGGATVTATQCEFMENRYNGVYCAGANTKARLDNCTMHHNGWEGLYANDHAVVDFHGTKTDIHSNKQFGICASNRAKVNIHLPSQHNTSHDNVREDRRQDGGVFFSPGSIANINADGTFTHT